MGITITPQDQDDHFWINDKSVYKDTNGNWVCTQELTSAEQRAFLDYRNSFKKL